MSTKPYVIGIAGGSGSGKTFFLKCFLNHFDTHEVSLVSQDDYYIPVGHLSKEENKLYNFDIPATINSEKFVNDIRNLIKGETVYKQEYTFNNPDAVPRILEIKPAPIVIIEGLFILHFKEIAELMDLKIFIDTDEEIALQRRLKRDLTERGYSHEDVTYKWINHVAPAYYEYLDPYKQECHKVVRNNTQVAEDIMLITEEISAELKSTVLSKNS